MVEYVICPFAEFSYSGKLNEIRLGMTPAVASHFTDDELIEFMADFISHEFLHSLLYHTFGQETTSLFDAVGYHVGNAKIMDRYAKAIRQEGTIIGPLTHLEVIQEEGFIGFLNRYGMTKRDVATARVMCNRRY